MNSTSFPALGNTYYFSFGETARTRAAKVDLQLLLSSHGTERGRFPQAEPRTERAGDGEGDRSGLGREAGEGAGMREKGRPERGVQGGSRRDPRVTDAPSRSPEGRWVGRSRALPSTSPQRPPGSPHSAGPLPMSSPLPRAPRPVTLSEGRFPQRL